MRAWIPTHPWGCSHRGRTRCISCALSIPSRPCPSPSLYRLSTFGRGIVSELVGRSAAVTAPVACVDRLSADAFEPHVPVGEHRVAPGADVLLEDLPAMRTSGLLDLPGFHGADPGLAVGAFLGHHHALLMELHAASADVYPAVLELSEADVAGVIDAVSIQKLGRFFLPQSASVPIEVLLGVLPQSRYVDPYGCHKGSEQ